MQIKRKEENHMCPYIETNNPNGGHCKLSGVYHDGYQYTHFCLGGNWVKCPNYENRQK